MILDSWMSHWRANPAAEYLAAEDFKNTFAPLAEADYEWVSGYARFVYDRLDQADRTLNEKADGIVRFLGGGIGIVSLGSIANLSRINDPALMCVVVSLVIGVVAVFLATVARKPRPLLLPPSVAWAITYAEGCGQDASVRFLAQWHLACEGMRLTIARKSTFVLSATWLSAWALATLGVGLVVAIATR